MAQSRVRSPLQQGKAHHYSPRNDDSPSRQLQFELERAFSQIHLHENERQRLHAFNRRSMQEELDAKELAQALTHKAEIEDAVAKHEVVRQQALAVLEAHIQEEEEQRRRHEEEERRRLEREARKKAEEQRRVKEEEEQRLRAERERTEAAAKAAYEKAMAEAEATKRKEREEAAQRERQAREKAQADAAAEAARKKEEDDAAAQRVAAKKAEPLAKQPGPANTGTNLPWSSDPDTRHKQYLKIHRDLKTFRRDFWEKARKDPMLKPIVGDMRRALRTSVGQLTDDKAGNKTPIERIKGLLLQALKIPSVPVVLNDYLPPHLNLLDKNSTTIPSLLLYLVTILSKAVISAFVGECAVNTKAAEPIGNMVAQVFAVSDLQFQRNVPSVNSGLHYDAFGGSVPTPPMKPESVSLITILMCKFHAAAPILFGVSGSETNPNGKLRLGWRRERINGADNKAFVLENQHYDRMIGLGAGYASIALRNFGRSRLNNPFPPIHFWESFAHIVNTSPNEIQTSHLLLLKSMLENSVDRFVLFFGAAAVAALREGLVELPAKFPPELAGKPAAKSLALLAESFRTEKHFSLT